MPTLNVAVAGLGFMGATHARAWDKIPNARLAAVISSDPRKLAGDLSNVGGNLDRPADPIDLSNVAKFATLEEALADPAIDALDICLPTDRHAPAAIAALKAGKHVLVEKPMALTTAECRQMIEAAKAHRRTLMGGQVLRFVPAWETLRALLSNAGPVRSAFFRRRCAAPAWSAWLSDPRRSGGGVFDLLIHDVDFCVSVWGMPDRVAARGYEDLPRGIDVISADLFYPDAGPIVVAGGWQHPKSYPFSMEFSVVTDPMTIEWRSGDDALRLYRANGESESGVLFEADPFERELSYFADCALSGAPPDLCPPGQSAQAVELMLKILESRARGGEALSCN